MMDPKQRDKCLKEVSLLESLKHPNIIDYLDSFIEENELLIAIEWAEKGDLKRLIKRAQADELPIEELKIWEYMFQIASALKHMQEKRIMHRDLKPANIFITVDGTLKLGDLGLGRYLSSQTIEAFSRVGTPLYMSPEVLKGSGYDWKSDVWSLGCVVYELACLRSPFRKDDTKMSLYDLFQTISKGEFPPIGDKYSEELKIIINSMIQVSPEKRLDIDQVVELCNIQLKSWSQKKPKVDISLIMDDIQEKLKLLDYENQFCRVFKHPPVSRIYFAHFINPSEQLCYFYDLIYWLMSLNKLKSPGIRPNTPLLSAAAIGDAEEIAKHILADVKHFGIKVAENIIPINIKQGYGEGVCVIINDLLNRELVRQDYKFAIPVVLENGKNVYKNDNVAQEIIEDIDLEMPEYMIWKNEEDVGDYEENLPKSSSTATSDAALIEREKGKNREKDVGKRGGILETNVDPEEWRKEAKKVASKLVFSLENDENPVQMRVEKIKKLREKVRKFVDDPGFSRFFEKKAESVGNELERIISGEKKMHLLCEEQISKLRSIAEKRLVAFRGLTEKRNRVGEFCEVYDKMQHKIDGINEAIEEKSHDFKSNDKLNLIRNALKRLREEVKSLTYKTAIARQQLDVYRLNN